MEAEAYQNRATAFPDDPVYDTIVIGGGFAGVTAARDLGERGRSVLLLEARDRLGGRTWYRRYRDTPYPLEFGGQWIALQWQPHVARETARYGLAVTAGPDPQTFATLVAGRRLSGVLPVPLDEIYALERALYEVIHASRRLDSAAPFAAPPPDLDILCSEFLARLQLPPATYEYLNARATGMMGCELSEVSTLSVLGWLAAYDHSAIAVHLGESELFADGTSSAIEAMVADARATVRTDTPVRRVAQDTHGVTVTTKAGASYRAATAVVAVPINVLSSIEFDPPLSPERRAMAAEGHCGRSVKIWALVRGAPPGFYGVGQGPGLLWLGTAAEWPEGSLLVGFGPGSAFPDVQSFDAVQRNVQAFIPGAELISTDAHDWNADPYAKGAWAAFRPGQLTRYGAAMRRPEGRLAFATSDIAVKWAGWIEGALASGEQAARQIVAVLSGQPEVV